GRPLGRTIQSAPFGFSRVRSLTRRARSAAFVAPKKITSLFLTGRPSESVATAADSSSRNAWSVTPIADATQSGFTPIFASRDGGCWIFCAHFSAAVPSANDARPSGNVTRSAPARASTFDISLNGIDNLISPPRKYRTSVSRRALPLAVRPLNVTAHVASAPMSDQL